MKTYTIHVEVELESDPTGRGTVSGPKWHMVLALAKSIVAKNGEVIDWLEERGPVIYINDSKVLREQKAAIRAEKKAAKKKKKDDAYDKRESERLAKEKRVRMYGWSREAREGLSKYHRDVAADRDRLINSGCMRVSGVDFSKYGDEIADNIRLRRLWGSAQRFPGSNVMRVFKFFLENPHGEYRNAQIIAGMLDFDRGDVLGSRILSGTLGHLRKGGLLESYKCVWNLRLFE